MSSLASTLKSSRAWACYDCGRCTASCPISRAGAPYSPRRQVLGSASSNAAVDSASLFSCLSCGLCESRCPAQVHFNDLVRALREAGRDQGVEPECPHGGALQSVMRMMAMADQGTALVQKRVEWLEGSGLQTVPDSGEVFYWTGCAPYFDAFFAEFKVATLEAAKASVRILNRLGVIPVVSPDERCCGHDLLWNGDRASFERLARFNVGLVERSGASLLVVSCAECLRTWKIDYAPFFSRKPPRIVHLAEYVNDRSEDLHLREGSAVSAAFQDPCRLGRHLGIYDAPRQALTSVPGLTLAEPAHNKARATCCAGGTWSNCDRYAKKIQVDRLREIRATGATILVTACPKCQIHLRCAMKDPLLESEIAIELRDVAEILAGALP